jgi:integrase
VASIDKRPDGMWRARWRAYPGGPQKTKHFNRKVDAERWLDNIRGDLARGLYIDPDAGRQPFGDYAREWQAAHVHRASTADQVAAHLRNHVLPVFGDRELGSIRPSEIQAWVKGRSEVLAPATLEVVYRYLSTIFKAATTDRLIARSPCVGIRLPQMHRARVVPLTTDDVRALEGAAPARYRATVILAAGTGLRQGEILGLTLDRIDFLRRQLTVDRQLTTVTGHSPYLGPPKTRASVRTVPLPEVVLQALSAHLAAFPAADQLVDWNGKPVSIQLFFTTARVRPVRRSSFGEMWQNTVDQAGLAKGTGFHELRHYYASLLIRHGESVKTVQARLGHASASETLDTYSHLWPDSDDRTRQAIDLVLGPSPSSSSIDDTEAHSRV